MKQSFFSAKTWLSRFGYACNGLGSSFKTEQTVWVHLIATIIVITFSMIMKVTGIEAIAITFATGFVWSAELFNTSIEKLADKVTMEYNDTIKMIKDISAAAVLIAAIVALTTGLIIFIPKFFRV